MMDDDDITYMLSEDEMLQLASEISLQDTWHNTLITDDDGIDAQDADLQLPMSSSSMTSSSMETNQTITSRNQYNESYISRHVASYESNNTNNNTPSGSIYGGSYGGGSYTNDNSIDSVNGFPDENNTKHDTKDMKHFKKNKHSSSSTSASNSSSGSTQKSKIFSKKKIIKSVTETVNSLSKHLDKHLDWFQRKYLKDDNSGTEYDESDANGDYDAAVAASLQQQDALAQQQYLNHMQYTMLIVVYIM